MASKERELEDFDLIKGFFLPLRAEIKRGRYDYDLVQAWFSATELLDLKVQTLLNKALQRNGLRENQTSDLGKTPLSNVIALAKPVRALARPISITDITKAYVELMIHRKRKRNYELDPETMEYDPQEIEPISIEADKTILLQQIKAFKQSSIDLGALLKEKTWEELIAILNILLHLAHERKIKLHQIDFPDGKILINYVGNKN